MCPQMACLRRCIVTLVAFVWLFSTVRFQMSPQISCLRRCIVALVAFVWLFSSVRFQMSPQITCLRRRIVTLVSFVWLFSTVRFQMCPQIACVHIHIIAMVAFVWFFSTVLIKCSSKSPVFINKKLQWLHLSGFSTLCACNCLIKTLWSKHLYAQWLHFYDFQLFVSKNVSSIICPLGLHLFHSSPVWFSNVLEEESSHWLHLFGFPAQRKIEF